MGLMVNSVIVKSVAAVLISVFMIYTHYVFAPSAFGISPKLGEKSTLMVERVLLPQLGEAGRGSVII
jgi:hypothetical protein